MAEGKMDVLWAPWRMEYILSEKEDGCIFCKSLEADERQRLVLYKSEHCFVMMNRYPYNNGHLMIAPYRHTGLLEDLTLEEAQDLMLTLQKALVVLKEAFRPDGFNIGVNIGKVAGAGVADHLHFHIVPRWEGDTNYMPVISSTRVIPEHLERTYERLLPLFHQGDLKGR